MKNGVRVAICVMLVVAVLAMSLSVFADDEEEETNPLLDMNNDTVAFLVWQLLDSWGIKVQYQSLTDFNREIQIQISNWIFEFLEEQPSIENVFAWTLDWYFETDFWGNLVVNETLLDDVEAFADWLIDKYNITNDATLVINPNYSVNGYTLYEFGKYYPVDYPDYVPNSPEDWIAIQNDVASYHGNPLYPAIGYIQVKNTANNKYGLYVVGMQSGTCGTSQKYMHENGSIQGGFGYALTMTSFNNPNGYYTSDTSIPIWDGYVAIVGGNDFEGTTSDRLAFFATYDIVAIGDTKIVTTEVVTPVEDPDYTPGDSMTIIDGQPNYSLIDWDGHVTVDNLPAIVSTGTVSNPGLETFWGFIPVLAEQTKDAIVLTRGLIYELPEEVVVTFYAVMGGLILFGIIKLMREH